MPNIVVYVPLETGAGMAMIRFESKPGKLPPKEEVVATTSLTRKDFDQLLETARQPGAAAVRNELQSKLLLPDLTTDKGKTVFFKDLFYYGLLPQSLNVDTAITIGSKEIRTAVIQSRNLSQKKLDPKTFMTFMGYPETHMDYKAVFGEKASAPLLEWQGYASQLRNLAKGHGFEILSSSELKNLGSKENILKKLEEANGIVFIVAHADGCHIRLPSGELVDLTPSDVSKLSLKRSPFVVLRICNGIDNGYANAFLKAGAGGVWANRGPISPEVANKQIELFMGFLSRGMTVIEAVRQTDLVNVHSKHSNGLFTLLKRDSKAGETNQ
jgi:hypothetical protein